MSAAGSGYTSTETMDKPNQEATNQRGADVAPNLKSSRYFWGAIFTVLTIIGFSHTSVSEGGFGFLWTIAWWATLIFTFKPESVKKMVAFFSGFWRSTTSSKRHLPALRKFFGKTLTALFVAVVGYLLIQWIMSSTEGVGSTPLAQLTLSDLIGFVGSIFISGGVIWICYRVITAIIAGRE